MLLRWRPVTAADAEVLVAMRIAAMRDSLMAVGRFDPERARMRFLSSFEPAHCFFIDGAQGAVGFLSLHKQTDGDDENHCLRLQHFYLLPEWHGRGWGSQVLRRLLARADRLALPVRLGALRDSPANQFYQQHGFVQTAQEEWDIHYLRAPATRTAQAIDLRPLTRADLAPLASILRQHVRDLYSGAVVEAEVQAILACMQGQPDHHGQLRSYLVAADRNGAVLGCMALAAPEPRMREHFGGLAQDALELLNVFVTRQQQGRGVGRQLLNALCEEARLAGAGALIVNSGPRYRTSWGFYDHCFTSSHGMLSDYYGAGRHARCWRLTLA